MVSTRRLYSADHTLLLSESRTLIAYHREKTKIDIEAQKVDIDSDSPEYAKLPASIRRISPVHVVVEEDRLVMTLGVWPRRYAIVTRDTSEVLVGAKKIDAGIWMTN